jgi:uncharacterized protein YdeI (YjbR/CyaY-like superfamily)
MPKAESKLPVMAFETLESWEAWLDAAPRSSEGIWLKLAKQMSGIASVSKQEGIEGALCHGWIDGQLQKLDQNFWLIRFTPRRAKSKWSEINRKRAIELIESGRMKPSGLAEVDKARADGRWDAAYAPQSSALVPDDLQAALNENAEAKRRFDMLDSQNRYAILHRVNDAKKAETRASRIAKYVAMLSRGQLIYPPKN